MSSAEMRPPYQHIGDRTSPLNKTQLYQGNGSNFHQGLPDSPSEDTRHSWTRGSFGNGTETPAMSEMSKFSYCTSLEDISSIEAHEYNGACTPHSNFENDKVENTISKLFQMLHSEDHSMVNAAAELMRRLSKGEVARFNIIKFPQLIASILCKINTTSDPVLLETLTGILCNLSVGKQEREGIKALFEAHVIEILIKLLSSHVENVCRASTDILRSMLLYEIGSGVEVVKAGGVQKLLKLLRSNNVKLMASAMGCLRLLLRSDEAKNIIMTSGGLSDLIRIMKLFDYEKLLLPTSSVIRNISSSNCKQTRMSIIAEGGMSALAQHLNGSSRRIVRNVLWTLRNISDSASSGEPMGHVIQALVKFFNSSVVNDAGIVACVAGILGNLTCNNQDNKMLVYANVGVQTLINIIASHSDKDEVTEPIICLLRHLTSRHPKADSVQNDVRTCQGIPWAIHLLQSSTSRSLTKAILDLVRNLSLCPGNRDPLKVHGAIQAMVHVLTSTYQDTQKPYMEPTYLENKDMEKIMECSVIALDIMSNDAQVIATLCNSKQLFQILNNLHLHSNEGLRRNATRLMSALLSNSSPASLPLPSQDKSSRDSDFKKHQLQGIELTSSLSENLLQNPTKIQKIELDNQYQEPIPNTTFLNIGHQTKGLNNARLNPGNFQPTVNNSRKDFGFPNGSDSYASLDPSYSLQYNIAQL